MANLQFLQGIDDAATGVALYTVSKVTEWDTTFSCPSSVIAIPGVGGGLNTRGALANPLAPRVASLKFNRTYAGTNYETERDALVGMMIGRELRFRVLQPDGSQRQNYGMLTDFTDKRVTDTQIMASFEIKFAIGPKWTSLIPASFPQLDHGILLDTGRTMDPGVSVVLAADSNAITLTTLGNYPETEGVYTITGLFDGPITVVNNSDWRGGNFTNFVYYPGTKAGDTLVVDSGINAVTINGVPDFDPTHFSWGGTGAVAQREFFRLLPPPFATSGNNSVGIFHPAGGATGGRFSATFSDVFV